MEESVRRQVLSDHTAFLCVDEEAADHFTQSALTGNRIKYNITTMRPTDMPISLTGLLDGIYDDGSS